MSEFLRHEPCPKCGSKDNLARYDDGHAYCFGCEYYEHADGQEQQTVEKPKVANLIKYEIKHLKQRKIDEDTCKKWDYGVGKFNGQACHVANYRDSEGNVVAQKLRFRDKSFVWLGETTKVGLYGSHLWRNEGKMVVVTEGELDALSVNQAFGLKYPCVSIPNGCKSAKRLIAKNIDWLETFETVVLCFDQDEQGRSAAKEAAEVLSPGKVKIVTSLGFKDANEALMNGNSKAIVDGIYGAKTYRPDGVVDGADCWDLISAEQNIKSVSYPWAGLNEKLFGMRGGELVTLTAGTGVGKSSVARELAYHLMGVGEKVGYIALEESIRKTSECLMGIHMAKPPHLWDESITLEMKREAFENTVGSGKCVMYDHWGSIDPSNLLNQVRYMARAMDCKFIFIDHLSIVVSALSEGDERRMIDNTMTKLRSLIEETGVHLCLISHLRRPEGRSHEEGGSTSLAQLRGSHAIAQLSDAVIGCERNQQDDTNANHLTLRVLKNRYAGDTGESCTLEYNRDNGRLLEWVPPDIVEVPNGE